MADNFVIKCLTCKHNKGKKCAKKRKGYPQMGHCNDYVLDSKKESLIEVKNVSIKEFAAYSNKKLCIYLAQIPEEYL